MRRRFLVSILFMLTLPVFAASTQQGMQASPIGVAYAGHTLIGGWCDCGTPGCICDPGENPGGGRPQQIPNDKTARTDETGSLSAGFLLAVAVLFWIRLRFA